ncbi:MAG TPA: ABC transporter permease [Candidatus Limnocylindrales bacterium]|nr:ABC transporter permease [Candidatus Limnocylindrales bacterium]
MPRLPESAQVVYLVARREFLTRVRSRFYIFGTLIFMILLAGYIVLQAFVLGRMTTTVKVGFSGDAQALAQPLQAVAKAEDVKVEAHNVADVASGQNQVRDGTLDVFVSGDAAAPDVAVKDQLNPTVEGALNALVKQVALNRALVAAGANPAAIEGQVAAASVHTVFLDPNAAIKTQRTVVGVFVAILLYVSLLIYGQLVAAGVVEEKANRIIEILLATVRPRQLLLGKVIGIGLVGLLQLVLLGVVALITVSRTQVITVPDVGVVSVLAGLLWYVLGFVLFALVYAAAASLVSRQEEIGAVTGPLSVVIVGTYLAFFWVLANPDNPIGVLISIIPPFSPIIMPARIATGDAQLWQVVVAVVLAVGAIAGLNALAARIYSNSVLRIGSRVRLIEAWRGQP